MLQLGIEGTLLRVIQVDNFQEEATLDNLSLSQSKDLLESAQARWGASPDTSRSNSIANPGGNPQKEAKLQ